MWRCEDVRRRRCEDVKMWRWEDVKWRWADVKMRRCEDVRMWRCEDEKMWRWEDVKMWCENEKMWRWEDVRMWRWEGVKMWRCEDLKMFDRPPLLEEPFAQTLSGKMWKQSKTEEEKKLNQKANKRENMRQTCGKNGNNNQIERANWKTKVMRNCMHCLAFFPFFFSHFSVFFLFSLHLFVFFIICRIFFSVNHIAKIEQNHKNAEARAWATWCGSWRGLMSSSICDIGQREYVGAEWWRWTSERLRGSLAVEDAKSLYDQVCKDAIGGSGSHWNSNHPWGPPEFSAVALDGWISRRW